MEELMSIPYGAEPVTYFRLEKMMGRTRRLLIEVVENRIRLRDIRRFCNQPLRMEETEEQDPFPWSFESIQNRLDIALYDLQSLR